MTPPAVSTPRWRLFVLMALQYLIWGAWLSSLWSLMERHKPSAAQQTFTFIAFPVAVLIGFLLHTHLADRVFGRARFFAASHGVSGLAILGALFAPNAGTLLAALAVYAFCFAPTLAMANAMVLEHARDARRDFGPARAGGTLGFLLVLWAGALAGANWSAARHPQDGSLEAFLRLLASSRGPGAQHGIEQAKLVLGALASWLLAFWALRLGPPRPATPPPPVRGLASWSVLRANARGFLIVAWIGLLLILLAQDFADSWSRNFFHAEVKAGGLGLPYGASLVLRSIEAVGELAALLVAGRLICRFGSRATLLLGVSAFAVSFCSQAFLPATVPAVVMLQALQGFGAGLLLASIALLAFDYLPAAVRASAQAWFMLPGLSLVKLTLFFANRPIFDQLYRLSAAEQFHQVSLLAFAGVGVAAIVLALFFHPPEADGHQAVPGSRRELGEHFENYPPLFDPVAQLARFLGVAIALQCAAGLFVLVRAGPQADGWMAAQVFGPCVFVTGLLLLIRPARRTNVFYLRAFKTDHATADLRTLLKGALGPDFRLSGIRRPKQRSSDFMKGFFSSLVALRYAGSHYMELEARDDWMARLVASYAHARLAFIDLRLLTKHVEREVMFTFACMGPARSIFLTDNSKDDAAWRAELAAVLPPADPAAFQLVNTERPHAEIVADVRAHVAALPPGPAGFSAAAMRFVRDHVSDDLLRAEARRRPGFMIALGAIAVGLLGTGLGLAGSALPLVSVPVALGLMAMFVVAWIACLGRAFGTAIAIRRWSGRRRAFGTALAGLLVPLLGFALLFASPLHRLQEIRASSARRSVENTLRQIRNALEQNEQDHGAAAAPKSPADFRRVLGIYFRAYPRDPWETEFVFEFPARRSDEKYDIYSCGPDKKPGTPDDLGNW